MVDPPAPQRTFPKFSTHPSMYDADDPATTDSSFAVLTPCTGCACAGNPPCMTMFTVLDPCGTPDVCPVSDCVGDFGPWDECSESCGPGTQERAYIVQKGPKGGGAECPTFDHQVTESDNAAIRLPLSASWQTAVQRAA